MIVGVGERGDFVAGLCFVFCVFSVCFRFVPLFKCCMFAYTLSQCYCVPASSIKILKATKSPICTGWYPISAPSSPSSSVVLVRSNRRRSPRQHKAHISTPISIHTNRRIRSRRKVGIRRRQALVMEFRPLLIALAPPNFDQDAGPKLTEAHIFPGAEGNPKPIPP